MEQKNDGYIGVAPPAPKNPGPTMVTDDTERYRARGKKTLPPPPTSFPWSLGFSEFVVHVLTTTDDGAPSWHSPMWRLARMVYGYFKEGTPPEWAFDQVDQVIRSKGCDWATALQDPELTDSEDAYVEFESLWRKVRIPPNKTPLAAALEKAEAYPLKTNRSEKRAAPKYDRFISVVAWLQVSMGDQDIMVPCHTFDTLLQTSALMISRWRRWALADRYVVITAMHECDVKKFADRKATHFRFDVTRWPDLAKAAHPDAVARWEAGGQ